MSQPVYLLVLGKGMTEAWYQLSEDEQLSIYTKAIDIDRRAGRNLLIGCDSRWADEGTFVWEVIEYPDMEAYLNKVKELEEMEWYRYFSAKTILGTRREGT